MEQIGTINVVFKDYGFYEIESFINNQAGMQAAEKAFRVYAQRFDLSSEQTNESLKKGFIKKDYSQCLFFAQSENLGVPLTLCTNSTQIFTTNVIQHKDDNSFAIFSWLHDSEGIALAEAHYADLKKQAGVANNDNCFLATDSMTTLVSSKNPTITNAINVIYRDDFGVIELQSFPNNYIGEEEARSAFKSYARKLGLSTTQIKETMQNLHLAPDFIAPHDIASFGVATKGSSNLFLTCSENFDIPVANKVSTVNIIEIGDGYIDVLSWPNNQKGVKAAEFCYTDLIEQENLSSEDADLAAYGFVQTDFGSINLAYSTVP